MPPAISTLVGKRSLNEVTGQENRVKQTSRLGPLHSTLLHPNNLSLEAGKIKPTFERLPCTLGNQVSSRDTCGTWEVAVRQSPPVLLFLWCFCREPWPAAEAAEVPGSVYHPDEGVPRSQARGAHLSGWVRMGHSQDDMLSAGGVWGWPPEPRSLQGPRGLGGRG